MEHILLFCAWTVARYRANDIGGRKEEPSLRILAQTIDAKSLASGSYELRHFERAIEACISEEIPFGNETEHAEQSGGKEKLFGGSSVFRQFEKTVVTQVCQHVPKHRD